MLVSIVSMLVLLVLVQVYMVQYILFANWDIYDSLMLHVVVNVELIDTTHTTVSENQNGNYSSKQQMATIRPNNKRRRLSR